MKTPALAFLSLLVSFNSAQAQDLPVNNSLTKAIRDYEDLVAQENRLHQRKLAGFKSQLIERYKQEVDTVTRKGDLDKALKLRDDMKKLQDSVPKQIQAIPLPSDFWNTTWYRFNWLGGVDEITFQKSGLVIGSRSYRSWSYNNGVLKIVGQDGKGFVIYKAVNRYTLSSPPGAKHFHCFVKKGVRP